MPITALQLAGNLSVTLNKVIAGFNPVKAGPNQINFDLSAIDLTVYTQAYQGKLTTTTTIDLTSFTNLAGESVALSKALAMVITCTGGTCVMTPGASNGLAGWFFPTSTALGNGDNMVFLRNPVGTTPVTVDATHKTITFTISGATVTVAVLGG